MYKVHACFGVCCSDCVRVCLLCSGLGVLKYVGVWDAMDVVFPVCIATRGAVGARVWGV